MGPSLITGPFLIERLFQAAGKNLKDYVDLVPLDPFYRVYFHDGAFIDYTADARRMKDQMSRLDAGDAARYDRFFEKTKGIYRAIIQDGLGSKPFLTLGSMIRFAPRALSLGALRSVYSFASKYFRHPHHRFLFSFHPLFIGGSPFRAPSVYIMIPYLEKEAGVWFARGGMYRLVEALARVFEELGGEIVTRARVEEIQVEKGRAVGVRFGSTVIRADAVVCNSDVALVYKKLIAKEWRRRWRDRSINRLRMSMSCFLLYLGVRKQFPVLRHHTIVLGSAYRELVSDIMDRKILPTDFSMYLHVPTKTDPSMAPPGCENIYVLVPVPNLESKIDWQAESVPFRERILDRLESFGLEGLRESLEVTEMFTPLDFESQLGAQVGNAFSLEPRLSQSAYFHTHNRSEDVSRLYFVGAGTHPGGGIPGVLLSAEATESCFLEDFGRDGRFSR